MTRQAYHHGNLGEALVQTALAALSEQRAGELSLRKLAAQLGVDHTAVYRHFRNKDALLAAMIEVAYRELNARLEQAWTTSAPWRERLKLVVLAYAGYAQSHPNLFEIMFGSALNEAEYPVLQALSTEGITMFVTYLKAAQQDGLFAGEDADRLALNLCMLCYGLSQMVVGSQFTGPFAQAGSNLEHLAAGIAESMIRNGSG